MQEIEMDICGKELPPIQSRWVAGEGELDTRPVWGVALASDIGELLFFDQGMSPDFNGTRARRPGAQVSRAIAVARADIPALQAEIEGVMFNASEEWPTVEKYSALCRGERRFF